METEGVPAEEEGEEAATGEEGAEEAGLKEEKATEEGEEGARREGDEGGMEGGEEGEATTGEGEGEKATSLTESSGEKEAAEEEPGFEGDSWTARLKLESTGRNSSSLFMSWIWKKMLNRKLKKKKR